WGRGEARRRRERAPRGQGGPKEPDAGRLRQARAAFARARQLDPRLPPLPPREEGQLAALCRDYVAAEQVLRPALQANPDDEEAARWFARAVALNVKAADKRAPLLRPLVERFPQDGTLAACYGLALARDGSARLGLKEYERARGLGTAPEGVVGEQNVRSVQKAVEDADRK